MSNQNDGKRIGWLDSVRMPSRIHRTTDEGVTTVCGHECGAMFESLPLSIFLKDSFKEPQWVLARPDSIPRRKHGRSNFCKVCFKATNHTIPWFEKPEDAKIPPYNRQWWGFPKPKDENR